VGGQEPSDRRRLPAGDPRDDVGDNVESALPRGAAKASCGLRDQRRPTEADRVGEDLLVVRVW